ncbi:endolytic transglycosylase MltG [Tepidimicrobium xylanilyticum]|uniref:endolytic transglycosylase MltG n=1 Tax=Tepidimicrobium xylanilyticum TaxID=1123352 RepID=UPI00264FC392|nr:endolytic transglycosylase MltG [Tepidimicrobium xylanilyticum]GMG96210.1 aminodeoxychorismate lyase [Tepidimicrobium xylanilyticum]
MSEIARRKRSKGILYKRIIFLLIIIISLIFIKKYYDNSLLAVSAENPVGIDIEVPVGSSTSKIANILKSNGLIRNETVFKIAVKRSGLEGKLKAGSYALNTSMSVNEIIDVLSKGGRNNNVIRFTIPEGYELGQIAEKLSKEGIVDKERFLALTSDKGNFQDKYPFLMELEEGQSLEGFLYPSTYEIFIGTKEEEIIEKMLNEFIKVFESDVKPNIGSLDFTLNEIVTLASIIEREAKLDEERELISAVFHNRLKVNMPLQSCATVQYILGERKEVLTDKDTQIESVYNTYINLGLPPAPIASPGKNSLIATVKPADVDYLFFRTKEDGTGAHTFTRTYEEHLRAAPKK